VTVRLWDRKQR